MPLKQSVLGYYSAVVFVLTGVLYATSMGILLSTFSIPEYTNLEAFLSLVEDGFIDFYTYSQLIAFLSCIFYVMLLCCIYTSCNSSNKTFGLLSVCFGLGFAILACLNYFVQFSIVRLSLNEGITEQLELLVQFNPKSLASAINMLGWTLFLGLSVFFLAMIFKEKRIKLSFFATSFFCLLGFIGFIVGSALLQLIFQLGMTITITIGTIFIAILIKGNMKKTSETTF